MPDLPSLVGGRQNCLCHISNIGPKRSPHAPYAGYLLPWREGMTRRRVIVLTTDECEKSRGAGQAIAQALASRQMDTTIENVGSDLDLHLRRVQPLAAFVSLPEHSPWLSRTLGLLEFLRIPHTGSSNLTSSVCRDRVKTLRLLGAGGLPVPTHVVLHKDYLDDARIHLSSLNVPVEVCSAMADGESTVVTNPKSLQAAASVALAHGTRAVAYELPTSKRISAFALDQTFLGTVETEEKTSAMKAASLPPSLVSHVARMCRQAHQILDCSGLIEVNFLVSDLHPISVLGVVPNPNLHPQSKAVQAAAQNGTDFDQLVGDVAEQTFRNAQEEQKGAQRGVG